MKGSSNAVVRDFMHSCIPPEVFDAFVREQRGRCICCGYLFYGCPGGEKETPMAFLWEEELEWWGDVGIPCRYCFEEHDKAVHRRTYVQNLEIITLIEVSDPLPEEWKGMFPDPLNHIEPLFPKSLSTREMSQLRIDFNEFRRRREDNSFQWGNMPLPPPIPPRYNDELSLRTRLSNPPNLCEHPSGARKWKVDFPYR